MQLLAHPFAPTRRFAMALLLVAPLWLFSGSSTGINVVVGVTGLLFAAILADILTIPPLSRMKVLRELPRTAGIGERTEGRYLIDLSWRSLRVEMHDSFPAALGRGPGRWTLHLRRGSTELPFSFTPVQRGSHSPGRVGLHIFGALGLVSRTVRRDPGGSVLITPSLAGVRRYRLLALQHRLRDAGVRAVRRRGQGTTFSNLREYAVGDDPRFVDWKATARRGRIITREYTVEQGQTVMIAVDAGRMMTQLSNGMPRFEYALSAALVLADVAVHSRDQVGLIVFDDVVRAFVPPAKGRTVLESIRDALIQVRPTMVEPDYAMAFRTLEARHRKRALIVIMTDVIDTRSSQAIMAHTARSAVRHLPLVVALRNEELVATADAASTATTAAALYQSAAAEELVSARDEALLRMRRAGVSVLDTPPTTLSAAVVNRYIELKARASL